MNTTKTTAQPMLIRGLHLDCRAQMLRFTKILTVMEDAARWGYNTILLEYSDRFPFEGRLAGIKAPDALTKDEVHTLLAKAKSLGLQVIPLQQCLGHLYYVLRCKEFAALGDGYRENCREDSPAVFASHIDTPPSAWSLCPSHPESLGIFQEMAKQILALHPGCRYFHLGGDEVALDPECPICAEHLPEGGVGHLLGRHYLSAAKWLRSLGPDPILWSDMILAYPETLASLRGHVTVMDWDYWSTDRPSADYVIWGVRDNIHNPEKWPEPQQRIVRKHVYATEPALIKPFPHVELLREQGFPVIMASAARSYGDSFAVPMARHMDNSVAAAHKARACNTLGAVVTSWALRRSPWPLTEPILMAAAGAMQDPSLSREEMDLQFAREHFGVNEPGLARIFSLLSESSEKAIKSMDIISSRAYFHQSTGHFYAEDYGDIAAKYQGSKEKILAAYEELTQACLNAKSLLGRAEPKTERQHEYVRFWRWAIDLLAHFAAFAPQVLILPGQHDKETLKNFRAAAIKLQEETNALLMPWHTDRTMESEDQIRFGVHLKFIDEMLGALL